MISYLQLVWCASPSTHRRRLWLHSQHFVHESDFGIHQLHQSNGRMHIHLVHYVRTHMDTHIPPQLFILLCLTESVAIAAE